MSPGLLSQLQLAAREPVCTSASVQEEARANLFFLSLPASELALLSATAVQTWVMSVAAAKRAQLAQAPGPAYPMCFYCWVDAQAGQLRGSLVAAAHALKLPFGCPLRRVDLATFAQEYIALLAPDTFDEQYDTTETDAAPFVLNVWVTHLP